MAKQRPKKRKLTPEQQKARLARIRAKVIADPNVAKLAADLKVPFEEYVEIVMKYAANPGMDVQVKVISDGELRAMGHEPVDLKKVKSYLQEYVDAQALTKSKFADPNSQREKVSGKGAIPVPPAATAEPDEVRSDLKEQFERERSSGKFKKF